MKRSTGLIAGAAIAALAALLPTAAHAASAPPRLPVMGFNTWYQYRTDATESDVLNQAHLLISTGLAAKGYIYVDLDDGWMASKRTAAGALTWDPAKFPDGIPSLASQLHAMGLKLGIYTAIGTRTCRNFPGSWAHYAQDAATFDSWNVDLVKVDSCGGLPTWATEATVTSDFQQLSADLKANNPDVVYSEELPVPYIGTAGFTPAVQASTSIAYDWRVAHDESPTNPAASTVLGRLNADWHLHGYAGPGHWNDLDMLLDGNTLFNWTLAQEQSQLSVWAEEASPLLVSADLAAMSSGELAALGNPHLIAIDQSGAQAATGLASGHIEALVKPDPEGGVALLLANDGTGTGSGTFTLAQLGISSKLANGYNIWTGTTSTFGGIRVTLGAGQTELFRVSATPVTG
jgi:alpha-galactosidase